jgi:four helix bundle protein
VKEGNIILEKSFDFAVRIVELHKYLVAEHREYELSKQVLRSGTSIGSNAEEAVGGVSKKDFANKFGISYKEARETKYWLRLLKATDYIDGKTADSLINDCEELIRIITAILNTSRGNNSSD